MGLPSHLVSGGLRGFVFVFYLESSSAVYSCAPYFGELSLSRLLSKAIKLEGFFRKDILTILT